MTINIHCPLPPSANSLWRRGSGRTYLHPAYRKWRDDFIVLVQLMKPRPRLDGYFQCTITLNPKKLRKGSDIDNRIKPALDALEHAGVIENDKLARSITVRYGEAPDGCHIMLEQAGSEG